MTKSLTSVLEALIDLLGEEHVNQDPALLTSKSQDTWPLRLIQKTLGNENELPLCVVTPTSTEDVSTLLTFLHQHDIAAVPYGGGSGVTGGAESNADTVVIDVGKMDSMIQVDEANLTVTIQSGVGLFDLENYLKNLGYTTGHYPQSIHLAQIGGLVANRSSGQFSTKYGNMEDLLIGLEAVLPTGEIVRIKNIPRSSTGPDLRHLFLGSEGTLGVITEVTVKIFPKPAERWMCAYGINSMREGLDIIKQITRTGWNPAVIRLHDELEATKSYAEFVKEDESILLILSEGPEGYANLEGTAVEDIIQSAGGRSLGAAPVEKWLKHRNEVSELDTYTSQGILVDTIDIAANWKDIANIYDEVTERLKKEVPELLLIAGHSSHSYQQGTNIYFILGAYPPQDPKEAERLYWKIWSKVMETTLKHHGTICHHHGVGKLRAQWMPENLGSSYLLLEKLKESLDPKGIMNRGTLLPTDKDNVR